MSLLNSLFRQVMTLIHSFSRFWEFYVSLFTWLSLCHKNLKFTGIPCSRFDSFRISHRRRPRKQNTTRKSAVRCDLERTESPTGRASHGPRRPKMARTEHKHPTPSTRTAHNPPTTHREDFTTPKTPLPISTKKGSPVLTNMADRSNQQRIFFFSIIFHQV